MSIVPSQAELPAEATGVGNDLFPLTTFLTEEAALYDVVATLTLTQEIIPALLIQCADPQVAQLIVRDSVLSKLCHPAGEG